jgi:hypothetical protein
LFPTVTISERLKVTPEGNEPKTVPSAAVVRRYSPGELSREVQILLESLFE